MACVLCQESCSSTQLPETRTIDFGCPICGHYRISLEAFHVVKQNEALAFDVGSYVYQQNKVGTSPLITEEMIGRIKAIGRPSTTTRAERYLGAVIDLMAGRVTGRFITTDKRLRIASSSYLADDCLGLAEYLEEQGAIKNVRPTNEDMNPAERRLLARARILHEEMAAKRASTSQTFVAMWFDPSLKAAYELGLAPAIVGAGYSPLRIDRSEHADRIDDRIIAEIRRSAFMVADFTGHRGGVYYEAGFARGLGRPILFTCRKDHLPQLHFDVRQYNTIEWEQPADIVKPLRNRILALFGAGPSDPDAKPTS